MVRWKFNDKWRRVTGKHLGLFKHNTGDDNGCDSDKVSAWRYPPRAAENRAGEHGDDWHLRAAGHKGGRHNRHTAVALIFNGTRCHDPRYTAAAADKHRDKRFTG